MAMTSACGAFADDEPDCTRPHTFDASEDADGTRRFCSSRSPLPGRVLSPRTTAFLMTSMLSDVVNYGTALTRPRAGGFHLPGSRKDRRATNDYVDAWFVGFHAASRDCWRCGSGSTSAHHHREWLRGGGLASAGVGAFHEGGDRERQSLTRSKRWRKGCDDVSVCRLSGELPSHGDAIAFYAELSSLEGRRPLRCHTTSTASRRSGPACCHVPGLDDERQLGRGAATFSENP